jgi:hypothetical protein
MAGQQRFGPPAGANVEDTSDADFAAIPGERKPAICPDCGHPAHWKRTCQCSCPDGPTRKRRRDSEHVSGHAPMGEGRTADGFY